MKICPKYYRLYILSLALLLLPNNVWGQDNFAKIRELVNKGNYFLSKRAFQEALSQYEQVFQLDPNNSVATNNIVEAHNTWGIYYYQQKKYAEALKQWQEALKLNPNHHNAKFNVTLLKQVLAKQNITIDENGELHDNKPVTEEKIAKPEAEKADKTNKTDKAEDIEKVDQNQNKNKNGMLTPKLAPVNEETNAIRILTPLSTGGTVESSAVSNRATNVESSITPADSGVSASIIKPSDNNSSSVKPELPFASSSGTLPKKTEDNRVKEYSNSLEDQLSSVEMKVYGKKMSELNVLQRLEKLETMTTGQSRTGTVKERIDYLRQSYGLP